MLKSCSYCGRLHERKYICDKKPIYQKKHTYINHFRSSIDWKNKREEIARRDLYLCQICLNGWYCERISYNTKIEVHHIIPINKNWDLRLDNDNLICLCHTHHEMAECGKIPQKLLTDIVKTKT